MMDKQPITPWPRNGPNSSSQDQPPHNMPGPVLIELSSQIRKQRQVLLLHELFEEVVLANPLAIALTFCGKDLNYEQLNRRANRVAHRLRRLGVGPESLVGISIGRSPEFIIGLLAIIKAGGAYVPLDTTYPLERLNFMLQDAHPTVVLTSADRIDVEAPRARLVKVTADVSDFSGESDENLDA